MRFTFADTKTMEIQLIMEFADGRLTKRRFKQVLAMIPDCMDMTSSHELSIVCADNGRYLFNIHVFDYEGYLCEDSDSDEFYPDQAIFRVFSMKQFGSSFIFQKRTVIAC